MEKGQKKIMELFDGRKIFNIPKYQRSYAWEDKHVIKYLKAIDEVFPIISNAVKNKKVRKMIKGPIAHSGFKRLT